MVKTNHWRSSLSSFSMSTLWVDRAASHLQVLCYRILEICKNLELRMFKSSNRTHSIPSSWHFSLRFGSWLSSYGSVVWRQLQDFRWIITPCPPLPINTETSSRLRNKQFVRIYYCPPHLKESQILLIRSTNNKTISPSQSSLPVWLPFNTRAASTFYITTDRNQQLTSPPSYRWLDIERRSSDKACTMSAYHLCR